MGILNATATYGRGFQSTDTPDRFSIRIYTGGFAGSKTADVRAMREIEAYAQQNGYTSHTVVSRSRKWIPSYYEYVIQFERDAA